MWFDIDEQKRGQIKQALLLTLVTKVPTVRRATASGIAAICSLELPLKLWPQIIPILVNNSSHNDIEIKKASLLTLGFICEEMVSAFISLYLFITKEKH